MELQTTEAQPNDSFRADDYIEASEKVLHQLHREKLLAIAELVGIEGPWDRFEIRGQIVQAIVAARESEAVNG